jgi:tetratricopeptide (TPR) repeat protein
MKTCKFFVSMALCVILLLALSIPAAAQSRAIKGLITDPDGEPIADVKIQISGQDFFRELETKTNKKGEFFYMLGMQPGMYRVIARKEGYQPNYDANIKPGYGEQVEVNLTLTPGQDYKLPFEMTDEDRAKYDEQRKAQEKRAEFSKAVKTHFENGVKLSDQEMYDEALLEFNSALELDPQQPGIIARIADIQSKQGKNDLALANYDKAIELDPTDPVLHTNRGVVLSKMGKIEESRESFKKAAEMDPMNAATNYYNLGVTLINSGNAQAAVEAFKQAISVDPGYAEAYYQLGMSLSGSQDTIPDAIKALEKYLEIGDKPEQVEVAKQIIAALSAQ